MPTTKKSALFTLKNDIILSSELSPNFFAANLTITPINNFYIHGELANFNERPTSHYNRITLFGVGAY